MLDIRPVQAGDISRCGEIMYLAFKAIADQHNFPPDFPNADVTSGLLGMLMLPRKLLAQALAGKSASTPLEPIA